MVSKCTASSTSLPQCASIVVFLACVIAQAHGHFEDKTDYFNSLSDENLGYHVEEQTSSKKVKEILMAIDNNWGERLDTLLASSMDADHIEGLANSTLLIRAASQDSDKAAEVLLKHNADKEYKDSSGHTALFVAAWTGSVNVVEVLLKHNVDLENCDAAQHCPLNVAAYFDRAEIVELLLKKGAQIHHQSDVGFTPLHDAAQRDAVHATRVLLKHSASTYIRTDVGDTALHTAAYFGAFSVVKVLLEFGANVNFANDVGHTALHEASARGNIIAVRLLSDRKLTLRRTDNKGKLPYDLICTDMPKDHPCNILTILSLRAMLKPSAFYTRTT